MARLVDEAEHLSHNQNTSVASLRWLFGFTPESLFDLPADCCSASSESPKDSGELPKRVRVRSSKYLNNLIEQDHRRIQQRLRPMLGVSIDVYTKSSAQRRADAAERLEKAVLTGLLME